MRRLFSLLCAAGLAVAPLSAAADAPPPPPPSPPPSPSADTFEWSTSMAVTGRARLGVMVIGITPELRKHFGAAEDRGVLVGRVEPGSAAAAAGLAVGDVLVEVRGAAVDSAGDVLSALAPVAQGDAVALTVIRDGQPITLQAKLTSPRSGTGAGAGATTAPPRWLDDWFDDLQRRFRPADRSNWLDELFRPWRDRGLGGGGGPSKRT